VSLASAGTASRSSSTRSTKSAKSVRPPWTPTKATVVSKNTKRSTLPRPGARARIPSLTVPKTAASRRGNELHDTPLQRQPRIHVWLCRSSERNLQEGGGRRISPEQSLSTNFRGEAAVVATHEAMVVRREEKTRIGGVSQTAGSGGDTYDRRAEAVLYLYLTACLYVNEPSAGNGKSESHISVPQ